MGAETNRYGEQVEGEKEIYGCCFVSETEGV